MKYLFNQGNKIHTADGQSNYRVRNRNTLRSADNKYNNNANDGDNNDDDNDGVNHDVW